MKFWETSVNDRGVVLARFLNPPMNYFCAGAVEELAELIAAWQHPNVKAVVLTGPPGQFITHYSVEELAAFAGDAEELERTGTALSKGYHALLRSLRDLPKPIIAAISGDCMGGGFELALWCDVRIAQEGDYRIGLPEIRMGIMPGGGGTQMVARLLGTAMAIRMVLLGELLTPGQAAEHGLVHATAPDCVQRAMAIAEMLSQMNGLALEKIKTAIYDGSETSLHEGLGIEARCFLDLMRSSAARHGMDDYLAVDPQQRTRWLSTDPGSTA